MANHEVTGLNRDTRMANAFGNLSVLTRKITVDAAQNDTIDFAILPTGTKIVDALVRHTALGVSVTMNLGLYRKGGSTVKEDLDALLSGADVAAVGVKRASQTGVYSEDDLTLDDDYLLRATLAGANPASGTIEVVLFYEFTGTP